MSVERPDVVTGRRPRTVRRVWESVVRVGENHLMRCDEAGERPLWSREAWSSRVSVACRDGSFSGVVADAQHELAASAAGVDPLVRDRDVLQGEHLVDDDLDVALLEQLGDLR